MPARSIRARFPSSCPGTTWLTRNGICAAIASVPSPPGFSDEEMMRGHQRGHLVGPSNERSVPRRVRHAWSARKTFCLRPVTTVIFIRGISARCVSAATENFDTPPGKKTASQMPFEGKGAGWSASKAWATGKPSTWTLSGGTPSFKSTRAVCSSATIDPSHGHRCTMRN